MALRHRKKLQRLRGEPIYPIGNMCDHHGCRKAGKRFDVDNGLTWLCEKHESDLPKELFSKFKIWS